MQQFIEVAITKAKLDYPNTWAYRAWLSKQMCQCLELGNMEAWNLLGDELLSVVQLQLGRI